MPGCYFGYSPFGSRLQKGQFPNSSRFWQHKFLLTSYRLRTVSKEVWLKICWCFFKCYILMLNYTILPCIIVQTKGKFLCTLFYIFRLRYFIGWTFHSSLMAPTSCCFFFYLLLELLTFDMTESFYLGLRLYFSQYVNNLRWAILNSLLNLQWNGSQVIFSQIMDEQFRPHF